MPDNVPFINGKNKNWFCVLGFCNMLNDLSCSALLGGMAITILATLARCLNRFMVVSEMVMFAKYHHIDTTVKDYFTVNQPI